MRNAHRKEDSDYPKKKNYYSFLFTSVFMEEKSKKHIESEVSDLDQSIDKRDVSELIPDSS